MRECSFLQIGRLTGFLFLLLIASYIIHHDIQRIRQYKSKTITLIKQLHESDIQNRELIFSRKKAIQGYAKLIQGHGKDSAIRYAESILQAS